MLRLKQERLIRTEWTLEYVASHLGITSQAVSLIELGKRKPSYDVLVKLEALFGLTHDVLFANAKPMESEQDSRMASAYNVAMNHNI